MKTTSREALRITTEPLGGSRDEASFARRPRPLAVRPDLADPEEHKLSTLERLNIRAIRATLDPARLAPAPPSSQPHRRPPWPPPPPPQPGTLQRAAPRATPRP